MLTVQTPDGRHHPARRFPGLHHAAAAGDAAVSPADMDVRRVAHAAWVASLAPLRRKLFEGTPLSRDDMTTLRSTWNKYMPCARSPYVPVRALVDAEWAVQAAGTSALCCRAAAPDCPHREDMLKDAARGVVLPAHADGNALLRATPHAVSHIAAMALAGRPFSRAPVCAHGRVA